MKRVITVFVCFLMVSFSFAGPGDTWSWGSNEVEAKGTWMYLEKLVQEKKYNDATAKVVWLLNNTPDLNVALYINAIKVYEKRAKDEKDLAKRVSLEDSTLMLYDKRIALFGDKAGVLNRKGKVAYDYLGERKNTSEQLYVLYQEIYALNGNETYPENLTRYLQSACTQYLNKKITKSEVIKVFNECNQAFDVQENSEKAEKVGKYRTYADQIFASNVDITCTDIQEQFGSKFAEKQDLNTAKIIVSLSVSNKCFSNEAFVKAGEYLSENNQSNYSLQKLLANVYEKDGQMDKALSSLNKALSMSEDSSKKATTYLAIADLEKTKGNKIDARKAALTALELDKSLLKAYQLIGDLYFQSAGQCTSENKVQARSVYIAAYHMYLKAGNNSAAAVAKAQFPSMEEMFLYNQKPGDLVNTGCWVGETVKLEQR